MSYLDSPDHVFLFLGSCVGNWVEGTKNSQWWVAIIHFIDSRMRISYTCQVATNIWVWEVTILIIQGLAKSLKLEDPLKSIQSN